MTGDCEEAKRLAQAAADHIAAHERQCRQMWSGAFFALLTIVIGWLVMQ